ncbi:MAG TPA: hypothetical protein VMS37_03390 [Verrucomicrobiae bacterium]|nr:hypothetical protein [Verrucomicrobiae bacterium]
MRIATAKSARLAVLVLLVFIATAAAQVRPALVKNTDEPGRLPYQNMLSFSGGDTSCPTSTFCIVQFPAVPAGKRLVVEQITILAIVAGGAPNFLAFGDFFVTNEGNIAMVTPAFVAGGGILSSTFYFLDRPVKVYYEPGTTPKVKIGAPGNFSLPSNMSLHGYLIDATN